MRTLLKSNDVTRRLYYRIKSFAGRSQTDEATILHKLAADGPRTFIEFGFHPAQFNCASLAQLPDWDGMLIDGDQQQVSDAKAVLRAGLDIRQMFLTLDNLDCIRSRFPKVGVLSIDVDGNDYWFLKSLIHLDPRVISIEYNASFLSNSVTIPYSPTFTRHEFHESGWYHGASLAAISGLCAEHGYGLAAVSDGGMNAFFTKNGQLDPAQAWKPNRLRDRWSRSTPEQQWEEIRHLPLVAI